MSLPGMIVLDTQPASLAMSPIPSGESAEAVPVNAFAQLLKLFLPPAPPTDLPQRMAVGSSASPEAAIAQAALPAPAIDSANLYDAQLITLGESLQIGAWPGAQTSAPSVRDSAGSTSVEQIFAATNQPTSQNVSRLEMPQGDEGESSAAAAEADTEETESGPRRHDELPVNDLTDSVAPGPQQVAPVSSPVIFHATANLESRDKSQLETDARQGALAVSDGRMERSMPMSAKQFAQAASDDKPGADVAELATATPLGLPAEPVAAPAAPRAPVVEASSAAVRAIRASVESQTLAAPSDAVDESATQQQAALPIAPRNSPVMPADRDGVKAESGRNEGPPSMAANLLSTSQATEAQKHSDGARRWPVTARRLDIELDPSPAPSRANQEPVAASMIAGAAAAPNGESHGREVTAPAWRPVVDRLAEGIVDHLRVGKAAAVLQLDPPELGKVKIDLRMEDGQLQVRIAAEGDDAQRLIEHHLPELHQALRTGQIEVSDLRMTPGEWQGHSGQAQNFNPSPQGRQQAPRGFASARGGDETRAEPPPQPQRSSDGRVSMWA